MSASSTLGFALLLDTPQSLERDLTCKVELADPGLLKKPAGRLVQVLQWVGQPVAQNLEPTLGTIRRQLQRFARRLDQAEQVGVQR
ncbi:MAG TPA: hypothetical protein VHZ55_32660 [Bryobacteraceae bacterium]|jgi:hypothetical protein|nr:hypothetical protein [Bryobacteraceae bacterium]